MRLTADCVTPRRSAARVALRSSSSTSTVAALAAAGAEAIPIRYDQGRPDDTAHLFRSVRARFGTLDVFVSNARADYDRFFESPSTAGRP